MLVPKFYKHLQTSIILQHGIYSSILHIYFSYTYIIYIYIQPIIPWSYIDIYKPLLFYNTASICLFFTSTSPIHTLYIYLRCVHVESKSQIWLSFLTSGVDFGQNFRIFFKNLKILIFSPCAGVAKNRKNWFFSQICQFFALVRYIAKTIFDIWIRRVPRA